MFIPTKIRKNITNVEKIIDFSSRTWYDNITVEGKRERLKINPKGSMNDEQKLTGR